VKFVLRTLAAAALVVSAANVGHCATASSRPATASSQGATATSQGATASSKLATVSSKLHDKKLAEAVTRLVHLQLPKVSQPKVASRTGAAHTLAAAAGQKGGVAGDPHKGVAGDPQKGGVAAAQKGSALAAVMPMQHAPAAGVLRAPVRATHVLPAVSRPPAIQVKPPPATTAQGGALSGTSIRPHPSALVALGGAETGKGTAHINGASVRPKGH
jgi:hypothetical protein